MSSTHMQRNYVIFLFLRLQIDLNLRVINWNLLLVAFSLSAPFTVYGLHSTTTSLYFLVVARQCQEMAVLVPTTRLERQTV